MKKQEKRNNERNIDAKAEKQYLLILEEGTIKQAERKLKKKKVPQKIFLK